MDALPGGGHWPVLLATRAYGQLRKLERDQKVLEIVHKRIKGLSSGCFTDDNHRRIIGTTKYIPIYVAMLPFDLRVIYHFSVDPDAQNRYDHQTVRVLRIESRAHVDYRFWVKVSRHLAAKGSEYQRRCTHGYPLGNPSEFHYSPSKFPCADYGNTDASDSIEYEGAEQEEEAGHDQEEIQNIIGLERYVPFSKALYNSIVADIDVDLPIVLDTHEREVVNCTKASIVIGRSGTGKTTALIYKMRAVDQSARLVEGTRPIRQLFVTRSRVLAQHVESTFRGLIRSAELASKTMAELQAMAEEARQKPNQALAEFDNEIDLREDLPASFSALNDSHFPLFVSFDKLCTLLEGDLLSQDGVYPRKTFARYKMIEFNDFREKYWWRFPRQLTSHMDPALVYSEIVAVIKGSSEALQSTDGYLSRYHYTEGLPRRVLSRLPGPIRDVVYSIFEQYQRLKKEAFEWDHADRTRQILKYFEPKGADRLVDYLYVDEVQDNLMLDIHLLRKLCPDIQGTYWSGDTAQTVVAGSAFRIKDLKSFVYQDIRDDWRTPRWEMPSSLFATFDLTVNFRSHRGIVGCAASIVKVIYQLFPDSIDKMPEESAKVRGPRPVLFTDSRDDLSLFEEFVLGSNPGSKTGFGAQQAILVRSDAVAEELDSKLEGLCPVLTIAESKGLEFDDVLIYNFFNHSSASFGDWQYVSGLPIHRRSYDPVAAPPVLCLELKTLYVAITRARKRCWIWDSGKTLNEMKGYLLSRKLITTAFTSEMIGRIGVTSTTAQWIEKGQEYFSCGLYKVAAACFQRAGRAEEARTASAYHQMSRAKLKHLRCDNESSRDALVKAADSMKQCAVQAAGQNARHYWFHVANCLQLAREFVAASDALVNGRLYVHAVGLLFENDQYDYGTTLLIRYSDRIEPQTQDTLLNRSRHHYFETRDYEALPRVFQFDLDAQLTYARVHGYRTQLKYLLKTHERYDELAVIYLEEWSISAGVGYSLIAYRNHGGRYRLERAVDATVSYAQRILLLEGQDRELPRKNLQRAITLVMHYREEINKDRQKLLDFFQTLLATEPVGLEVARTWNPDVPRETVPWMLAFSIALIDFSWVKTSSLGLFTERLLDWNEYILAIRKVTDGQNPCSSEVVQLLLGIRPLGSDHSVPSRTIVFEDSLILTAARREKLEITSTGIGEYSLRTTAVNRIIKAELAARLQGRLRSLHTSLLKSHWTRPCYGVRRLLNSSSRFVTRGAPGEGLRQRFQAVTWAMCDLMPIVESPVESTQQNIARKWVRRLHDLVYPPSGIEEDLSIISTLSALPGQEDLGCLVVSEYLPAAVAELEAGSPRPVDFFSAVVSVLTLAALLDPGALDRYVPKNHSLRLDTSFEGLDDSGRGDSFAVATTFVDFFRSGLPDGLTLMVSTLEHILNSKLDMDAAIMVHVVELVTREMIFSLHATESNTGDGFAGLLLPRSWAKSLVKTQIPRKPMRETQSQESFVRALATLSTGLKFETYRWTVDSIKLGKNVDMLHMLSLRLFWCASMFVLNVTPSHASVPATLQTLRTIAANLKLLRSTPRDPENTTSCDVFSRAVDHTSCLAALRQTLRHEQLVLLSNREKDSERVRGWSNVSLVQYVRPSDLISRRKW
ncbi:hypothetical protein FS749_004519 [Ceratobasidium sp. UAMH 11750]|nr:hypothetical protein FS749_004519 [Ceratobasidium sp. UAMH 11750]